MTKLFVRLSFLFCFFAFTTNASADVPIDLSFPAIVKDNDSSRVIWANWYSETEGLCVFVDDNDNVIVSINILTKTNQVNLYPTLQYKYVFGNVSAGVSAPLTANDLTPTVWLGENIYIATYVHKLPFGSVCLDPNQTLALDYSFEVVTPSAAGGHDIYPIGDYIGTFFPNFIHPDYAAQSGIEMGQKTICCRTPPDPGTESRSRQRTELSTNLHVSPNPFDEQINIRGTLSQGEAFQVEVYDLTGKQWYRQINSSPQWVDQSISTADFPPGIYFVRVNGQEPTKLVKTQ